MTREAIIDKTLKALSALPAEKVEEVADFADYILKKYEDDLIQKGIEKLVEQSGSFNFLAEEEVIYSIKDVREKY